MSRAERTAQLRESGPTGRGRAGFSLIELLATLVLGGLVCAAAAGTLRSAEWLSRSQAARVAEAEALRVPSVVLLRELRWVAPGQDLALLSRDSVRLRAFRGTAVVCGRADGSAAYVRYAGIRQPNPAKDSVVALDAAGHARVFALSDARAQPGACGAEVADGDTETQQWRVGVPLSAGTLLLLFESGSYHLADRAFRYRRGRGGRQPLTDSVFDDRASGFRAFDASGNPTMDPTMAATLALRLAVEAARWESRRPRPPRAPTRVRITFPNRRQPPATHRRGRPER